MGKRHSLWALLEENMELHGESMPGEPVVELAGDRRVLIERHGGVTAYSHEKICVKMRYGTLSICGRGLELRHMSRETLCVWGKIHCVELRGKG